MVSDYRALVDKLTKRNSKNFTKIPSWSNRALSRNFSEELRERMKTFNISGVSAGTRWIQNHSTTIKALQISSRVITWYNLVSYLGKKIVSDIRRQMSVKGFRLYVKAKPKIHDNLFHREHRTRRHNPHSIFQNLPQMLTNPPRPRMLHYYIEPIAHWQMWRKET